MARSTSSKTRSAKDILRAAAAKVAAAKGGAEARGRQSAKSSTASSQEGRRRREGGQAGAEARKPAARKSAATKASTSRSAARTPSAKPREAKAGKAAKGAVKASTKTPSAKTAPAKKAPAKKSPAPRARAAGSAIAEKKTSKKEALASRSVKVASGSPTPASAKGEERSQASARGRKAAAVAKAAIDALRRDTEGAVVARAVARPAAAAPPPAPPIAAVTPVRVELPEGYKPSADEPYMNPLQLEYFRRKLLKWREELVEESRQTLDHLRSEVRDVGDEAERATRESENALELRTRDRYRKLIAKIDSALRRIDDGSYGYCDETGEPIGLERLEARPIATLSLDAQERRELLQRQLGE